MAGLTELVADVASSTGVSQERAREIIKQTLVSIDNFCGQGEPVVLKGFGKFYPRIVPAHTARNPSTGGEVQVREKQHLKFKQSACR